MALDFRRRLDLLHARYGAQKTSKVVGPRPEMVEKLKSLGYLAGGQSQQRHSILAQTRRIVSPTTKDMVAQSLPPIQATLAPRMPLSNSY
jgi:hypothetical protein